MTMSTLALAMIAGAFCQAPQGEVSGGVPAGFHDPVMLRAGGEAVRVEAPGYAAPAWGDVDGDGDADLLVGQFRGGKIRVYPNDGEGGLAAGLWLEVDGDVVEVPGVW